MLNAISWQQSSHQALKTKGTRIEQATKCKSLQNNTYMIYNTMLPIIQCKDYKLSDQDIRGPYPNNWPIGQDRITISPCFGIFGA